MTKPEDKTQEFLRRTREFLNDPNLFSLIANVRESKREPGQDKIVKEYLNSAKRDLKASRILHGIGDHANAVFHLQQSVEKLTKAYALHLSFITLGEAKEVSHYSPQLFFKLLQRDWVPDFMRIVEKSYPNYDQEPYRKLGQTVKDFRGSDKKGELAKIPSEGFEEILKLGQQIENAINTSISMVQGLPPSFALVLGEQVTKFGREHGFSWNRSEVGNAIGRIPAIIDQLRLMGEFSRLYLLCVVTYPHATTTRYPGEYLKPSDYKPGLGIVDSLELLWEELQGRFGALAEMLRQKGSAP